METTIDYCVSDPIKRLPEKVIIHYQGTENVIRKDEVNTLTNETVKLWQLCGLNKEQIKEIVGFLKDKK